jgi:hypothetical protein
MVPSTATQPPFPWKAKPVDEVGDKQHDFVIGYMNENHPEFGRTLVTAYRRIGTEMAVTSFHRPVDGCIDVDEYVHVKCDHTTSSWWPITLGTSERY